MGLTSLDGPHVERKPGFDALEHLSVEIQNLREAIGFLGKAIDPYCRPALTREENKDIANAKNSAERTAYVQNLAQEIVDLKERVNAMVVTFEF